MGSTPVAEGTSTASGVCATSSRLLTWAPNAVFRRLPLAWPATILICSISKFDIAPLAGGKDGRHRVTEAGSQEVEKIFTDMEKKDARPKLFPELDRELSIHAE